jgi:hypothetical protein
VAAEYNKFDNVHSIKIRAGNRRTYFFDVKQTKGEDYYLSITESTRKFNSDLMERHKVFVYKEDFNKFLRSLQESIDHIKSLMPDYDFEEFDRRNAEWEKRKSEEEINGEESTSETSKNETSSDVRASGDDISSDDMDW